VLVQAFIPETPVETLDIGILGRLAYSGVMRPPIPI
jgi:hypothetical protein